MGFWIFMLISDLLIPFSMIGLGGYFVKSPPKKINAVFGYRTAMSMKNKDTWSFAHGYCGKLWRWLGWVLLGMTAIGMPFVAGKSANVVSAVGGIICGVQLVAMIGSILPTEIALKKAFDENGFRRR